MNRPIFHAIGAIALAAALLLMTDTLLANTQENLRRRELQRTMEMLLPGSGAFTPEDVTGHPLLRAAYRARNGCVVEAVAAGYAGDIVVLVGVTDSGEVSGVMLRDLQETYGLGFRALRDEAFLAQFPGTAGDAAVGDTIRPLSGATVTSRAIARAVNAASAYVSGGDVYTEATERGY